jgi:uncharacterized protein (TIGR02284 family)
MHEGEKMADVNSALRSLIEVLHDGHRGMMEIGKHLQDEPAKLLFLRESQVRAEYAAELENELHRLGQPDVHQGGTSAGTVHRIWGTVKAQLGGGDHTLLTTAEEGEDEARSAYDKILQEKLPGNIHEMLVLQQEHISQIHDQVKSLRDSHAA